jgi:glycosyltransferase involved in cell wall biosynthesis
MRIVAIIAAYNEERFIGACLKNLITQGLEAYLIDNSSTDRTVAIAEQYLGRGLIGIETFPRDGMYSWQPLLARKEDLAAELDADWFLHVDADEIRLPPNSANTLAEALSEVDAQGYNAVNFLEFAFIPTKEAPDHDHLDFQRTMRRYYPFLPQFPHRLNAWKRQAERVDLVSAGGHKVSFDDLNMYPHSFPMRHYLFLSVPHANEKYIQRQYDPHEVKAGWHRARAKLKARQIRLPSQVKLRHYTSDDRLDATNPRTRHFLFDTERKWYSSWIMRLKRKVKK